MNHFTTLAEQIKTPDGQTIEIPDGATPEMRREIMKSMMQNRQGERGKSEPPSSAKEKSKPKKKEDDKKKTGDKPSKEDATSVVKKPSEPKKKPDQSELDVMPVDGKIRVNFQGHPWPAMIEWYSRASGREVEWQELPKDYINFRTQRSLSMPEVGNHLNRMLLVHGYTILDDGDFMQIVKTEGLNPSFVPRVRPSQLATMGAFSFARVSFRLTRFKADELVKELEPMKSKHGTLAAMTAANRIEAMDTVGNLRDIYAAIDGEESSGNHAPREFEIKHLRASVVKTKIEEMFKTAKPQLTPQQLKQMQQMQQRNQQKPKQPQKPASGETKLSIVVNELRNSIIVKTAPNVMVDIAAAIELLDVELTRDTLDIKAYTLATRSPQEVSEILQESGALSPQAIVRVDKKTKALLVSGSKFDHFKIEELIKRIDGNARRFVSIRLRRYPAAQVATTIESMMGKPKEDKKNNRRRYYYSYWDDDEEEEDPGNQFRVSADVENNKLILKCNEAEYEMVIDLLTQMGEVMTRAKYAANEVVLEGLDAEDDLLRRVQQMFNATSENKVILPPPTDKPLKVSPGQEDVPPKEVDDDETDTGTAGPKVTLDWRAAARTSLSRHFIDIVPRQPYKTRLAQIQSDGTKATSKAISGSTTAMKPTAPPIVVRYNAQGKLVIQSDDPAALEKFEELLRQMAPPRQDWVHFRLQHVTALWMKLQLQDFFDEEEETNPNPFFFFGFDRNEPDESPAGLGDERKMRFIDDGESTLVVRNASSKQLATIRELIKLYDITDDANAQTARFKKIIQIQHSTARIIETTLKDAFRDLLSSNDKAFANQKGGGDDDGRGRRMSPFNFSDSTTSALQGTSFKGKISFGVDESTNRLIVTAEGKQLLDIIVDMVDELDVAAIEKDDTRVIAVPASVNSQTLRETLTRMFGADSVQVKPKENQGNGEKPQQNNNGEQPRRNGRNRK